MPKSATRPGPYPVALIPGQYQHYYKRFLKSLVPNVSVLFYLFIYFFVNIHF